MEKEIGNSILALCLFLQDPNLSFSPELLENVELRWALSETSKQLEENVDRQVQLSPGLKSKKEDL